MARLQITCINKSDRFNPHERIINVGGNGFRFSQKDAIDCIEKHVHTFFVSVGLGTADVVIATHNGNKYLKTVPDKIQADNLLSLPECG